ncbi:PAS domain S-box protein [Denitratisoma sp. DHT3]|uniref:GAF domain-containing sensor histidine kinase n=1 Tax=Denitratisoma sp. DHT3 TaxID=1981880 RepID=UPI0011A34548|nr:PAS domain S-box protein [Denitratisoma sp. DHT3]
MNKELASNVRSALRREQREPAAAGARHADLYESAPVGYLTLDRHGDISRANDAAGLLLNTSCDQLVGHSLASFIIAADRNGYDCFLQRALGSNHQEQCEAVLRRTDGAEHYVRVQGQWDEQSQELLVVLVDISDRRAVEKRLSVHLAAMSLFHDITTQFTSNRELAPLMDAVVDTAIKISGCDMGLLQTANPENGALQIVAQHGCPPAMLERLAALNADSPSPDARAPWQKQRTLSEDIESASSTIDPGLRQILRAAGVRAMLCTPLMSHHGRFLGMVSAFWRKPPQLDAIVLDLIETLAHQVAALLDYRFTEHEREQLARLIEYTGHAVITTDLKGCVTYMNPAGRRLIGMASNKSLGELRFSDYVPPEWHEFLLDTIGPAIDERGVWVGEMQLRNLRTGALVDVFNTVFLIRDPQTRGPWCYASVNRDITETKRTDEELKHLQAEMQQLLQWQVAHQTVAAIAHEINQPLNAVTAYSEAAQQLLGKLNQPPEKLAHVLECITQQADRAGKVVRELITFLDKGETTVETIDLKEVVRKAIAVAKSTSHGKFRIATDFAPDLKPVRANRPQISKVIVVLLQNSMDAMLGAGSRGRITISGHVCAEGDKAHITIQDQGPGLDATAAQRIFEPFFTTKPRGIGMGLTISRALIEAQGGKLWCEIGTGPGATFHFTLPLAP